MTLIMQIYNVKEKCFCPIIAISYQYPRMNICEFFYITRAEK
mgnify:CR=1 FL=1